VNPGIIENHNTVHCIFGGCAKNPKFLYEYDFGDSWEHKLLMAKVLPCEAGKRYPVCLTGKRTCPPEDCGGVWGYAGFWMPPKIRSIPSMRRSWTGSVASLIQRPLIWTRSIGSSNASSNQRWE
jgi:pRiA4b ORF-3-like protein